MKPSNQFRKAERLKRKKYFGIIFASGKTLHRPPVTLVFHALHFNKPVPVQVAFTVPKRRFKLATTRNKLKRRMREAFRQHKHDVYETLTKRGQQYGMVFVYTGREAVSYDEICDKIIVLLQAFVQSQSTENHEPVQP